MKDFHAFVNSLSDKTLQEYSKILEDAKQDRIETALKAGKYPAPDENEMELFHSLAVDYAISIYAARCKLSLDIARVVITSQRF